MPEQVLFQYRRKKIKLDNQIKTTHELDDMDDSLLMEILHRIPCTKTLFRSKSVCKRWRNLLATPYFMWKRFSGYNNDDRLTDPNPYFIISRDDRPPTSLGGLLRFLRTPASFKNHASFKKSTILASCKDLILCGASNGLNDGPYYVVNQFTKQCRTVPVRSIEQNCILKSFGLSCYSSEKTQSRDRDGDGDLKKIEWRHRVVRLCIDVAAGCLIAEVFSFETERWENAKIVVPPSHFDRPYYSGIACNGLLYWLGDKGRLEVIAFDPYSMEVGRLIPPPQPVYNITESSLGVCRGVLRLLQVPDPIILPNQEPDSYFATTLQLQYLIVWELTDYKSGQWRKVHQTPLEEIYQGTTCLLSPYYRKSREICYICPFGIHPNDTDTVFLHVTISTFTPQNCTVAYNLQTKEAKLLESGLDDCYPFFDFPVELPWWPTPLTST